MAHLPELPSHHADPFDRMLVCQSLKRGLVLVTSDPLLGVYSVICGDLSGSGSRERPRRTAGRSRAVREASRHRGHSCHQRLKIN
jgi:hypothetical protein